MAARASRVENQDAIDAAIVGMLGDPKEVYQFMVMFLLFGVENARLILSADFNCQYSTMWQQTTILFSLSSLSFSIFGNGIIFSFVFK